MTISWNQYFLSLAEVVKTKSKDESTQIGAVIVGEDHEIVSTGYNSFPRGIHDDILERQQRPEKYYWFEHAERNAIYNAARVGAKLKGCVMYLSCGMPCTDCTRAIINSGIKEVWCKNQKSSKTNPELWDAHAERSVEMFKEAGVCIRYYEE